MTQWFAVVDDKSGRLVSQGTVLADPLPDGLVAVEIVEQNPEGFAWNEATRAFDIALKAPLDAKAELAQLVARIEAAQDITEAKAAAAEVKGKLDEASGAVADVGVIL